jgi:hypothetical protein
MKYDRKEIIKLWKQTHTVHTGYGTIAKKIGCSKALVAKVIQIYLKGKNEAVKGKFLS